MDMSMKQLLLLIILIILATISFGIQNKTIKKLKYEICGNSSKPIDSSVRLLETNIVLLIAEEWVYELQMTRGDERPIIKSVESVFDWSDQTDIPINMIITDDDEPKAITLVNCELKFEWKFIYEDDINKGETKYECGSVFEVMVGKTYVNDLRYTIFPLEYFQEDNVKHIRILGSNVLYLRSNDSSDTPIKYIKWVYQTNGNEMETSYPFTELNGQLITAGFIYDNFWYLFGGRYYCRMSFVDIPVSISYQECNPSLISDWFQNCDEEVEVEEAQNQPTVEKQKSPFTTRLIVLSVIILIAFLIVLVVFCLICKEVSRKSTTHNSTNDTKGSSGSSRHS